MRVRNGFTMIEMMIVVVIVGVLAVLAIYGVRKYISNSKTAEARNTLGVIAKGAAEAYTKEGVTGSGTVNVGVDLSGGSAYATQVGRTLCPASTKVPATPPPAKKYQSALTEWTGNAGWKCLKFQMEEPQYFSYQYTVPTTTNYVVVANGDLNGDGAPSTFQLYGSVSSGVLLASPTILETNPEE
jgi:type IV pilus assembly protein PilA